MKLMNWKISFVLATLNCFIDWMRDFSLKISVENRYGHQVVVVVSCEIVVVVPQYSGAGFKSCDEQTRLQLEGNTQFWTM
jgi:hypothetical protein